MKKYISFIQIPKYFFLLIGFIGYCFNTVSQTPTTYTSSELLLQLKKLNVLGSVLYIAAHPDDENTKLLAYLSKEKMCRTAYLSLTRGDGGQNLIGNEQGVELGMIRTQELLAARRIDGAEQFFSTAFDFGYSKNPDEALNKWNHEKILGDVVWLIRYFKPDVIICRFPTTGEGGHGHHTASAILAEEAYDIAGDSTKYSEQLKQGISIWKPNRLLWNTFNFGSVNTQKEDQFKFDIGTYNSLLGKSYGEIAALSRSQHKSQGFGVPAQRGTSIEYFSVIKGEKPVNDLFEGVEVNWRRISHPEIQKKIDSLINNFQSDHPEKSIEGLLELHKSISAINNQSNYIAIKLKEIENLIIGCSGIYFEAVSNSKNITENDSLHLSFIINNRIGIPIEKAGVFSFNKDSVFFEKMQTNKSEQINKVYLIGNDFKLSQPYWLKESMNQGSFHVDKTDLSIPENKPLQVKLGIKFYNNIPLILDFPIVYKFTDPVKGEIYEPVFVIPALNIIPEKSIVITKNHQQIVAKVKLVAGRDVLLDRLVVNGSSLKYSMPMMIKKSETKEIQISLTEGHNSIEAFEGEKKYNQQLKEIQYDHVPDMVHFVSSDIYCKNVNLKIAGKKIGYIEGAGDKVKEALSQMGYEVEVLTRKDVMPNKLKKYDAIVTGVRAYNINLWLNDVYDVLMNYINEGGVLLVQYNTSNQIGPLKAKIGPYPFSISRERITDENANVNLIFPQIKIFNYPNKIDSIDFEGWVQERSIYHAADIDSHYQKPISMKDSGESENDGSLITANYGKGKFIYTGISFFRQLPAGVSGAYRLFANLLASGK